MGGDQQSPVKGIGDTSEAMSEGVRWIMSPGAKMGECKEKEVWGEMKPGPDARGSLLH